MTFNTIQELQGFEIPEEIRQDCLNMLALMNQLDSTSKIAIATTQEELSSITKQVHHVSPEVDEYISNTPWRKRVYILDDYGNGIVLYDNVTGTDTLSS